MAEGQGDVVFGCITPHPPLLIPAIGKGEEAAIAATSSALARVATALAEAHPDSVAIISPHGQGFADTMGVFTGATCSGDMRSWGDPSKGLSRSNDVALARALLDECSKQGVTAAAIDRHEYSLDHGVMVPMHFLATATQGAGLLPLTFSSLSLEDHFEFGQALTRAARRLGRRLAVIASGDLSHRLMAGAPAGFDPQGKVFDHSLVEALRAQDVKAIVQMDAQLVERAGECGLRSIIILLGALDGTKGTHNVLSYEGPFGVGYLVSYYDMAGKPVSEQDPLARFARKVVESHVLGSPRPALPADEEMKQKAGVFVCLKKRGELRGCIGTFEPTRTSIAEEIAVNAVASAINDPRFPPVTSEELADMEYTVDVLTRPEAVGSLAELDPKEYGVIVEAGRRRGLLLPDLEGVDTVDEQIAITRQKARIGPNEPIKIYRFQVQRHK